MVNSVIQILAKRLPTPLARNIHPDLHHVKASSTVLQRAPSAKQVINSISVHARAEAPVREDIF